MMITILTLIITGVYMASMTNITFSAVAFLWDFPTLVMLVGIAIATLIGSGKWNSFLSAFKRNPVGIGDCVKALNFGIWIATLAGIFVTVASLVLVFSIEFDTHGISTALLGIVYAVAVDIVLMARKMRLSNLN